jgi:sigma-E factor negative regulatory protein RseA
MKTEHIQNDQISAMLDGELSDVQLDSVLASLSKEAHPEGKKTWEIYHQIGDVLRSDELAVTFSADFSTRFSALLEAEPVVIAPNILRDHKSDAALAAAKESSFVKPRFAAWTMTGMAAAAAVAFFMAPQLISMMGGQPGSGTVISQMESQNRMQTSGIQLASDSSAPAEQQMQGEPVEMLRDPRLDSYLMAHQKFSPSIGNGTQYITRANAVSAAPSDSEK